MKTPDFFEQVEQIKMVDPLANILGAFEDGFVEFEYVDVVKLAGHSCPTVAGAYLMTSRALKTLYPDTVAVRGQIDVSFAEALEEGVAGVISMVVSQITGATDVAGFKGLKGKFARHSLMHFETNIASSARFKRVDTGESVDVVYDPSQVPASPEMMPLMQKILEAKASDEEIVTFGRLWQDRVKRILIDHADDVIKIQKV